MRVVVGVVGSVDVPRPVGETVVEPAGGGGSEKEETEGEDATSHRGHDRGHRATTEEALKGPGYI